MDFCFLSNALCFMSSYSTRYTPLLNVLPYSFGQCFIIVVKLGSLVSHTEWSKISERNSNLIENLKKGPELTL